MKIHLDTSSTEMRTRLNPELIAGRADSAWMGCQGGFCSQSLLRGRRLFLARQDVENLRFRIVTVGEETYVAWFEGEIDLGVVGNKSPGHATRGGVC